MDEQPPVVLAVLLHPVVARLDVLAVEEPEDPLLQLAAALAGDDLDRLRPGAFRLVENALQRTVDVRAPVVDVVQVEGELHRGLTPRPARSPGPGVRCPRPSGRPRCARSSGGCSSSRARPRRTVRPARTRCPPRPPPPPAPARRRPGCRAT